MITRVALGVVSVVLVLVSLYAFMPEPRIAVADVAMPTPSPTATPKISIVWVDNAEPQIADTLIEWRSVGYVAPPLTGEALAWAMEQLGHSADVVLEADGPMLRLSAFGEDAQTTRELLDRVKASLSGVARSWGR